MIYGGCFDIDNKYKEIDVLEKEMSSSGFWDNIKESNDVLKKVNDLKSITSKVSNLKDNIDMLIELSNSDIDSSMIEEEYLKIKEELDSLEILLLLDEEYDKSDCILDIHPGAGGTESCDWALMLYRMYIKYIENKGFKYKILDYQEGEEAGIKSVSISISGEYAYGFLKCEKGIHRLVRLSPFDSNHRRHTSFAAVEVVPRIDNNVEVVIDEKDIKIDVFRSSGAGGQGVNTTDSAIRVTHLPSKIVVTCQNERSQTQNKEEALRVLKAKLLMLEKEKKEQELLDLKGELASTSFGFQIRSYIMHPYNLVKDHRTKEESSNVAKVLDGDIDIFIEKMLKYRKNNLS